VTGRRLLILGLTAVWLVAIALVIASSVDAISIPPWGNAMGDERSAEVAGDTQIGQRFTAPFPGLYRIEVALDPSAVHGAHQLTFHLETDLSVAEDYWTETFSTKDVQDGTPYYFEFPPIHNSAEQTYYFYLESASSTSGDAIAIRYSSDAILDGASALVNGQPVKGSLQFHTYYNPRTWDKIDLLLTRIAESRPYLFGIKGLYVGLTVAYVIIVAVFLWVTAQAVLGEEGS
jgi:hypothetical protein